MDDKKEVKTGENRPDSVPYIVFEGEMTRAERKFNKVFWALILAIALLVGTNVGWLIYESQFEEVLTVTQDVQTADDAPAYVNGTGEMTINGENTANNN